MKALAKKIARRLGYEIRRTNPDATPDAFDVQRRLVAADAPLIFDVGAHVGQTAARYRELFPRAQIHCFEPSGAAFERLQALVDGDDRTTAHRLALSDTEGAVTLHANAFDATNSLLATDARGAAYWGQGLLETAERVEAQASTVDAFCRGWGIEHIDILKLDVQGAEYLVLQGAADMLRAGAVSLVYSEIITAPTYQGQRALHEYMALLDSFGYRMFDLYNAVRKNMQLIQADLLFTRHTASRATR